MRLDRMRNLVTAVEEAETFFMGSWAFCALGNYCRRTDLQDDFIQCDVFSRPARASDGQPLLATGLFRQAAEHFDVPLGLALSMFGDGLGRSKAEVARDYRLLIAREENIREMTGRQTCVEPKTEDPEPIVHRTEITGVWIDDECIQEGSPALAAVE